MKQHGKGKLLCIAGIFLLFLCVSSVSAQHTEWFLEKTASPGSVTPGDLITYTITWTKIEENDMYILTNLTDTLDSNVEFVSASGSYHIDNGVVVWEPAEQIIDSVDVTGDTLTMKGHFLLVVRVRPATPEGTVIHNSAMVGGFDGAEMWDWAAATADATVVKPIPTPEFPGIIVPCIAVLGMLLLVTGKKFRDRS